MCRFKDQGDKKRYQRDEDKLFKQAVSALKTADELYPDKPRGSKKHSDSDFATGGGGAIGKARQKQQSKPLPRPPRSKKSFSPNFTEIFLILSGISPPSAAVRVCRERHLTGLPPFPSRMHDAGRCWLDRIHLFSPEGYDSLPHNTLFINSPTPARFLQRSVTAACFSSSLILTVYFFPLACSRTMTFVTGGRDAGGTSQMASRCLEVKSRPMGWKAVLGLLAHYMFPRRARALLRGTCGALTTPGWVGAQIIDFFNPRNDRRVRKARPPASCLLQNHLQSRQILVAPE